MTLLDFFLDKDRNDNSFITFIEGSGVEKRLTYAELKEEAQILLGFLQSRNIGYGDELVIQVDDNITFIISFWACIIGGIIPVPLALGRTDDQKQKLFNVWKILSNPSLLIDPEYLAKTRKHGLENGEDIVLSAIDSKTIIFQDIALQRVKGKTYDIVENDIAYIQFSSGSTGNPKGVTLTHGNLVANILGILDGIKSPKSGDTFFSWMPLTHDMGLIGFHLTPFVAGWNHYIMTTSLFIRHPFLWLEKISEHRASFTASPNFGYGYLMKRFRKDDLINFDLSCLRIIVNGAEPISANLCAEFSKTFGPYGLKKNVIFPVYGLAEASLAVTFTDPNAEMESIAIARDKLGIGDRIVQTDEGDGFSTVKLGKGIKYCTVRIVDQHGATLGDEYIGQVQIKGKNVTRGYYNDKKASEEALGDDGWLNTGDLGFVYQGELYISGRIKDIIFVNGQNYYAHDLEKHVESLPEIGLGKVVICGTQGKKEIEQILVFIFFKGDHEDFITLKAKVKKRINGIFGFEPTQVIRINSIPKTTSGKVRRYKLIEFYNQGMFEEQVNLYRSLAKNQDSGVHERGTLNEIAEKIYAIWETVLGIKSFGTTDRFFDIGGNSLKGGQVISYLEQDFGVKLNYDVIYEKQTIQELEHEIKSHTRKFPIPLAKAPVKRYYPLSSTQKRLYYVWKMNPLSVAYNVPIALDFKGALNVQQLEMALNTVISHHDILRATFSSSKGLPRQFFRKSLTLKLKVTCPTEKASNLVLKDKVKPFDLEKDPLIRAEILRISSYYHILFLDIHHIVTDGISFKVLFNELVERYDGRTYSDTAIQFKDYIFWEKEKSKKSSTFGEHKKYWAERLKGDIPVLDLPIDFPRPKLFDFKGKKLEFFLDRNLVIKLRMLAKKENVSLHIFFLAVYNVFLSKLTSNNTIMVGIPVAGRDHYQLQGSIGLFVNNLVLKNIPSGDKCFTDFLSEIKRHTLEDLNNQNYPFDNLLEDFKMKREISRNAFFDTMLLYNYGNRSKQLNDGITVNSHFFDPGFSKFDLTLEISEHPERLRFYFEYSTSLFKRRTLKLFAKYFETLILQIVGTPKASISQLSLLPKDEFEYYNSKYNDTQRIYRSDRLVHKVIEEQALKDPDKTAVICREDNADSSKENGISFGDLDKKASQLANFLRRQGVHRNIPVVVALSRNTDLIISILAIMKSGGCYLPVDKDLPKERVTFILNDSKAKIILTDRAWVQSMGIGYEPGEFKYACSDQLNISEDSVFALIADEAEFLAKEPCKINISGSSKQLAYIIYTSGSTGKPKGTKVTHRSLMNYLDWARNIYANGSTLSFPLFSSISFDFTLTSIFLPLISGNTIIAYPLGSRYLAIEQVILDNRVEIIKVTPSHLRIIKELPFLKNDVFRSTIKTFVVGGENLPTDLAREIGELFIDSKIYNEYGPTETTIGCMSHLFIDISNHGPSVPIGSSISNTRIYLLDKNRQLVPEGIIGEIYIAGDCLSAGYLGKEELTSSKFMKDIFFNNELMYQTGDLAKRLPDGVLEYVGRTDDQIKINGHRIEPAEIQEVLLQHDGVKSADIVFQNENSGTNYLTAFVQKKKSKSTESESNLEIDFENNIKTFLAKKLPRYMIPAAIMVIDELPMTMNGKVDKGFLKNVRHNEHLKSMDSPRNNMEEVVLGGWQHIFASKDLTTTDNFFELGGDSIKAVQLSAYLLEKGITVGVKDILLYATVRELSPYLKFVDDQTLQADRSIEGELELSPIQSWFFGKDLKNPNFYNQSVLLQCKEAINKTFLVSTLETIVESHDTLRLNFDAVKGKMFYNSDRVFGTSDISEYFIEDWIKDEGEGNVELVGGEKPLSDELSTLLLQIKSTIDISNSFLFKVAIIKTPTVHLVFITIHHLIVDGISWRILLKDLYETYQAVKKGADTTLPPKTASALDYQEKILDISKKISSGEIAFWKHMEKSQPLIVDTQLKKLHTRDQLRVTTVELDTKTTDFLIKKAHKTYNTNAEILLVTALVKSIGELTSFREITIEMENHGRNFEGFNVSRSIGWFTALYPVKFILDDYEIDKMILHVKDMIKAIGNRSLNYGIAKYINKTLGEEPDYRDVRFNYLGQFGNETANDLFTLVTADTGIETDLKNQVDSLIEIDAMVIHERLRINIKYVDIPEIRNFAETIIGDYQKNILHLLDHIGQVEGTYFSPSDFDMVTLDKEDLKILFE